MAEDINSLLQPYRDIIEAADRKIVAILVERHKATDEIGKIKEEHGIPPFQPAQHELVLERLRNLASEHGMDPERLVGDYTKGILTQSVEAQTVPE